MGYGNEGEKGGVENGKMKDLGTGPSEGDRVSSLTWDRATLVRKTTPDDLLNQWHRVILSGLRDSVETTADQSSPSFHWRSPILVVG